MPNAAHRSPPFLLHRHHCLRRPYPAPWADRPYLLHLGLQCYDRGFLRRYCALPATPLQVC